MSNITFFYPGALIGYDKNGATIQIGDLVSDDTGHIGEVYYDIDRSAFMIKGQQLNIQIVHYMVQALHLMVVQKWYSRDQGDIIVEQHSENCKCSKCEPPEPKGYWLEPGE